MRQSIPTLVLSILASAVLSANRFISLTGGVPAAGGNSYGVTQTSVKSGELAPVAIAGTEIVETGAAIAVNALIQTDNQGRAITKDTGATLARMAPGQAAATGAGQFVEVILIPN